MTERGKYKLRSAERQSKVSKTPVMKKQDAEALADEAERVVIAEEAIEQQKAAEEAARIQANGITPAGEVSANPLDEVIAEEAARMVAFQAGNAAREDLISIAPLEAGDGSVESSSHAKYPELDPDDFIAERILRSEEAERKNPVQFENRQADWLKLRSEIPEMTGQQPIGAEVEPSIAAPPHQPSVKSEADKVAKERIAQLKLEVEEMRMEYIKEDFETMSKWTKLQNIFGKSLREGDKKRDWQEKYEQALLGLQTAEVNRLKVSGITGSALKNEMERLMVFSGLDEKMNVIDARTQYRTEHQNLGETIADGIGKLGRWYNRIPLKKKLVWTVALTAGTAMAVAGGMLAAGGVAATAFVLVRKGASGAGTFVGVEAFLESRAARKDDESGRQRMSERLEKISIEGLGADPEQDFAKLSDFLREDILSLDQQLQTEKRAKFWRKTTAAAIGGLVGSGWVTQLAVEHLGGSAAWQTIRAGVGSAYDHLHDMVAGGDVAGSTPGGLIPETKILPPIHTGTPPDFSHDDMDGKDRLFSEHRLGMIEDIEAQTKLMDEFVGKDITVEKGDSVWKIAGRLADQLKLTGGARTHFIDVLKNQVGERQLKLGETFNFSAHGVNGQFVENALTQAHALSSTDVATIEGNDARIAEYAKTHPSVTITEGKVDDILSGDHSGAVGSGAGTSPETSAPPPQDIQVDLLESESDAAHNAPAVAEAVDTGEEIPEVPEIVSEGRVEGWAEQLFLNGNTEMTPFGPDAIIDRKQLLDTRLMDIIHDASLYQKHALSGYTSGWKTEQLMNFVKFDKGVGASMDAKDFSLRTVIDPRLGGNGNATVKDYLRALAPKVLSGQRIGLFTTR